MTAPKLIDTHCHLNFDYAPKTSDDLVREARESGIEILMNVGTEIASIGPIQALSEKYPNYVFHSVGVHPHDTEKMTDEDLVTLEKAAHHPQCRAIGEIGIDYYYSHSNHPAQKLRLEQQLDLARKVQLPVIIHSRDGEEDLYQALKKYAELLPADKAPGVIHCFSGTVAFGQKCLDLGFYISFSGILTFKKAEEVRTAARIFPLDRILVETDSPFLAPVPFRGKKCEPVLVKHTAQQLADLRQISLAEIARETTANARRLFRF